MPRNCPKCGTTLKLQPAGWRTWKNGQRRKRKCHRCPNCETESRRTRRRAQAHKTRVRKFDTPLTDAYVRRVLTQRSPQIHKTRWPQSLVNLKRAQISLRRRILHT